jgi:hypothetical protein
VTRSACLSLGRVACLALAAVGCAGAGTETGNPPAARHMSLALVLRSTNSEQVTVGSAKPEDHAVRLDSAWIADDTVELFGCVGLDQAELGYLGWDLLHPKARGLDTELQNFCGVRLATRVADANLGAVPAGFAGASLWMTGTRADGIPLEVRSSAVLNLTSQSSSNPLDAAKLVLSFDAAAWFAGVNVNSLVPDADGVVHMSPASNPLALQTVELHVGDGAALRPEASDDGVLDD